MDKVLNNKLVDMNPLLNWDHADQFYFDTGHKLQNVLVDV
ncbi:conserved hypothetical protein [Leuconostoc gasicomitatum]|nr:conserved hypothetical protein [Leuconostoc gasicomitatum]